MFQIPKNLFLVYSVIDRTSFDVLEDYAQYISKVKGGQPFGVLLVGNKSDNSNREVTIEEGAELAELWGIPFIEISSEKDINISKCIEQVQSLIGGNPKFILKEPMVRVSASTLAGNLLKALDRADFFSDITLKAEGRPIYAHKVILAARSSVFKDKLQNLNNNELALDYSYDVAIALCKFIYGADTEINPTIASNLLKAANEFKLDKLSKKCEDVCSGKKNDFREELQHLSSDLKFALGDTKYADVTFLVDNTKITGHKVILAARSGFMQGLLASGMKESRQEDAIELHDIQLPIFNILKEFMYSEIIPSFEATNTLDILQQSHLFGIHRLTELSEAHLAESLSNANVFSIFKLCEFYDLEKLQKVVFHYLKENIDTLIKQSEFKDLDKNMKKRFESLQDAKKELQT